MDALAVVIQAPEQLELRRLALTPPSAGQVIVEVEWSGISTGTERLLWSGRMPPFPGLGYPLVPGYESVGRVIGGDPKAAVSVGDRVFVPGASCFGEVRGLFGGAASHLVVPAARVIRIEDRLAEEGVLLALAATAQHALAGGDGRPADLIIGHGVLGRLLARLALYGLRPLPSSRPPARLVARLFADPDTSSETAWRLFGEASRACGAEIDQSVFDRCADLDEVLNLRFDCAVGEVPGGLIWWRAAAAMVVALALQVATNYANDYSDGIRGTDADDKRVGPVRLVGQGLAKPSSVKKAALASFAVAGLVGTALALALRHHAADPPGG